MTDTEVERMKARLKERVRQSVEKSGGKLTPGAELNPETGEIVKPPEKTDDGVRAKGERELTLNWLRIPKYREEKQIGWEPYILTTDGVFVIEATTSGEDITYTAWKRTPKHKYRLNTTHVQKSDKRGCEQAVRILKVDCEIALDSVAGKDCYELETDFPQLRAFIDQMQTLEAAKNASGS